MRKFFLILIALCLCFVGVSYGALDLYEPFDYTPGNTIVGESGAMGTTGPWASNGNGSGIVTNALAYPGLVTGGQALFMDAIGADCILTIPKSVPGWGSGVKWMSCLYREKSYGGHFYTSGGGSFNGAFIHGWGTTWMINNNGNGVSYSANTTYLVVAKVDWTAGVTYLWVNPTDLITEPSTNDVVAVKAETQGSGDVMVNSYGTDGIIDEIRIGDTYQDVVVPLSSAFLWEERFDYPTGWTDAVTGGRWQGWLGASDPGLVTNDMAYGSSGSQLRLSQYDIAALPLPVGF